MQSPEPVNSKADGRGVLAILGPTNTGKTHMAIERMVAHSSGLIGLPLRLLAREVYQRVCEKVGTASVSLITGEEKITPPNSRFEVCTVEAMPTETDKAFVAIDEVQLAADFERGHVFTDRLMNLRGRHETLLLGAATVEQTLCALLPGLAVRSRPRMSMLTYAGSKKITRIPARSAIIAFSTEEVYAIAELIRRQRGGAAVVLGSLSPRTRNAQVELYQNGDVDFLVATDAIGMGLNLDLDHVAFAQDKKFDGFSHRKLFPAEMAQIAGRAGRHMRNGTFGVTGQVEPFGDKLVESLETHNFDSQKVLIWRNRDIDFSSLDSLKLSLEAPSANRLLIKSRPGSDQIALAALTRDALVADICRNETNVRLLWEVCLTPDYRKISPGAHAEILGKIFIDLAQKGRISEDWLSKQIARCDKVDGDIDALSARIAQIRTWTYLSNRPNWLENSGHWQEKTSKIEDSLSDALHKSLTKRFIDRRTSMLMRKLKDNTMMDAEIKPSGEVMVEGHNIGELHGFRFVPDSSAQGPEAKAANAAAIKSLASEIERRAGRLAACPNSDILLSKDGILRWIGEPVARLVSGENLLRPGAVILADELLSGSARESVVKRIARWIANHIANILKPLVEMSADQTLEGMARGVAFRIVENLGNIDRREITSDIQSLDQDMRATLRRHGVRFGAYNIFVPALLKPAPAELLCLLWGLKENKLDAAGLDEVPNILASGRTSTALDPDFEPQAYRLCGYRILGQKAVRIDILERLADLIRPTLFWKPSGQLQKPEGAIDGRSFYVTPAMMSILGATHEDMELILKGLGYQCESRLQTDVKPAEPTKLDEPPGSRTASTPEQAVPGASNAAKAISATPEIVEVEKTAEIVSTADEKPKMPVPAENIPAPVAEGTEMVELDEAKADIEQGPKMILVWRQKRPDKNPAKKFTSKNRLQLKTDKPNASRSEKPYKGKPGNRNGKDKPKPIHPKRPEKPLDPDSPFAKLAALKENMKSGGNK